MHIMQYHPAIFDKDSNIQNIEEYKHTKKKINALIIDTNQYSIDKTKQIMHEMRNRTFKNAGEKINFISRQFLGTPYVADRLIGSQTIPERLVIDLKALDCFTFIDYVEAFRRAKNASDYPNEVIRVRYKNNTVAFLKRRHFFSDWAYSNPRNVKDVTTKISPHAQKVTKRLNEKSPNQKYISGLPIVTRNITYIPSQNIDANTIKNLHVGDYIGIYSPDDGMDVSHVGLYTKVNNVPIFRNTSSLKINRKVVDSPFLDYVKNKPGIIVFRVSP
jgi:Protein of unknown function (DUF1460)